LESGAIIDNHVSLLGTVTREPTFYEGETPRLKMTIRIHREFVARRTGEAKSKDSYFDIVTFNQLALDCQSLHYGDLIVVLGKLNQRTIESDDGNKHSIMEVSADHVGLAVSELAVIQRVSEEIDVNT
jgi:single-stranded DNA-binding protein